MKTTTHRITYKPGDVIKIKPLSDIHYGVKGCDVSALKRFLAESDDNTRFFGLGDTMDSIVVTDPRYSKSADDTPSATIVDDQIDGLEEIIAPYKERILGLGRGNHEDTVIKKSGTDPMGRLCKRLGVAYLGYSGLMKIVLRQKNGGGKTVVIRYHHGWGGGSRTQGADLTKYSKDIAYWDADVYLYGHVHRRQSDRIPRMGMSGDKLISKPIMLGICGTFLKTYTAGTSATYSEIKGYPPVEIGGLTLNIKPEKYWVSMWIDV